MPKLAFVDAIWKVEEVWVFQSLAGVIEAYLVLAQILFCLRFIPLVCRHAVWCSGYMALVHTV
nr:hypothetical protein [Terriglobus roseus]